MQGQPDPFDAAACDEASAGIRGHANRNFLAAIEQDQILRRAIAQLRLLGDDGRVVDRVDTGVLHLDMQTP